MRYTKLFILLAVISFLFTTCKEDIDTFIVDEEFVLAKGNIDNFFTAIHPGTSVYLFNADEGKTIFTPRRTNIRIPANAFVYANGDAVTGPIQFELIEIYEKGDMVKYNRPTISNNQPLNSGGALFLQANQGSEILSLANGVTLTIQIENSSPNEQMEVFYGDDSNPDGFNWLEADGNPQTWDNVSIEDWDNPDGTIGYGYEFLVDRLNWINCDAFVNSPSALTSVCIELPEAYTNKNTVAFISFDSWNGVMPLWGSAAQEKFCQLELPIGEAVSLLIVSEQGTDTYHFDHQSLTITENMTKIMDPIPTTLESIVEVLDDL